MVIDDENYCGECKSNGKDCRIENGKLVSSCNDCWVTELLRIKEEYKTL